MIFIKSKLSHIFLVAPKTEVWFFRNILIKKHSTDIKLLSMPMKAMYYDLKKSKFIFLFIFIRMVVKTEVCDPQNVGLV